MRERVWTTIVANTSLCFSVSGEEIPTIIVYLSPSLNALEIPPENVWQFLHILLGPFILKTLPSFVLFI